LANETDNANNEMLHLVTSNPKFISIAVTNKSYMHHMLVHFVVLLRAKKGINRCSEHTYALSATMKIQGGSDSIHVSKLDDSYTFIFLLFPGAKIAMYKNFKFKSHIAWTFKPIH
jgi:hypothetical protein